MLLAKRYLGLRRRIAKQITRHQIARFYHYNFQSAYNNVIFHCESQKCANLKTFFFRAKKMRTKWPVNGGESSLERVSRASYILNDSPSD
jgi:hypothetical protein